MGTFIRVGWPKWRSSRNHFTYKMNQGHQVWRRTEEDEATAVTEDFHLRRKEMRQHSLGKG